MVAKQGCHFLAVAAVATYAEKDQNELQLKRDLKGQRPMLCGRLVLVHADYKN